MRERLISIVVWFLRPRTASLRGPPRRFIPREVHLTSK